MATDGGRQIFIGFEPREADAFAVARFSAQRRLTQAIPVHGLVLAQLRASGLYTRATERRGTILWDTISDAPMSTEHANSRFLAKFLSPPGWVLFMDGDVMVRGNLARLFDQLDDRYALYCVKHAEAPSVSGPKMDGQIQQPYSRKWQSSVFALNSLHPSNEKLTVQMVNAVPGRDLHRFCWLRDEEIGTLHPRWNYLVGISPPVTDPAIVHFTLGTPSMPGFENCEYADEWRTELGRWAS